MRTSALIVLLCAAFAAATITKVDRICIGPHQVLLVCEDGKHAVATAEWEDMTNRTGWSSLRVYGDAKFGMESQAKAMGYLEGKLTQKRIFEAKTNMFAHAFGLNNPASPKVAAWYAAQLAYVRDRLATLDRHGKDAAFWNSLEIAMSQFDGLVEGYNAAASDAEKMTELDLYIHNGAGDLEDLGSVLPGVRDEVVGAKRMMPDMNMLDCSALVRLTTDGRDVLAGHTTWRDYGNMAPRAYKTYHMNHHADDRSKAWSVSFSSTPGFLSSKDDFYIVKSGWSSLAVMETTNAVFNGSLYHKLTTSSVLTWQRTMIANLAGKDGQQWTDLFALENSGTYNNQWQIVDYNAFARKADESSPHAPPGTLWILEQIPGYTRSADVTGVLNEQGYWASYNVPYFPDVYEMSGYGSMNGTQYSYDKCPRANIFRVQAVKVEDVEGIKRVMQYNDYKNDPLSLGSPLNAISSRYDLVETGPRAFGGIDSKVTSADLAARLEAMVISGPTQQQPAFSWSAFTGKGAVPEHMGQPDVFDFPWESVGGLAQ